MSSFPSGHSSSQEISCELAKFCWFVPTTEISSNILFLMIPIIFMPNVLYMFFKDIFT